jgi:hypothetical protein
MTQNYFGLAETLRKQEHHFAVQKPEGFDVGKNEYVVELPHAGAVLE